MIVTVCQTAEGFLDGKRTVFGYQPNLKGFHRILENKLRAKKHILAEKSKKL